MEALTTVNVRKKNLIETQAAFFEELKATWNDFQNRHVTSTVLGTATEWNNLLCNRIQDQFGKKRVNTFVVNTANAIRDNFPSGVPQVS